MKILDRYIAKNYLYGYFIALFVMIGMFVTIDLFMNVDEFSEALELEGVSVWDMISNIVAFYAIRCALWFKDMAGMIIVIAAVFSLARMTRNNELIAVMASGVSLKRILAPILILAVLLTGLMVVDQEFLIPGYAYELTRSHDDLSRDSSYDVWFVGDNKGNLISSYLYEEKLQTLHRPLIILRQPIQGQEQVYRVVGKIWADFADYNSERGGWDLINGKKTEIDLEGANPQAGTSQYEVPVDFYETSLTARDLPIRKREGYKSLLSLRQLNELQNNPGVGQRDMASLAVQKHSRITDPIMNLIMVMVALPVLVCRDPKAMKTAIIICFLTTISCFIVGFACKLFAAEVFFGQYRPVLWTWIPIFIFFPVALIEIDGMKT